MDQDVSTTAPPERTTLLAEHVPAPRRPGTPAPRRRAEARPLPVRDEAFDHLDVDGLRSYRQALTDEEGRVSYWRRILQARLDVVEAGSGRELDTARLRPVLTSERVGAGRRVLSGVVPSDEVPPLPSLAELWDRRVPLEDSDGQVALDRDLRAAEGELSAYRATLHARIGAVTGELIARYREQPGLCLSALPSRAGRRHRP